MTPTFVCFKSQASRPEQSVMQALESLTETQVSITHVSYMRLLVMYVQS